MPDIQTHAIAATTHGRVLVRPAASQPARGVLAGFHGYSENAAIQMPRLEAIPGAEAWTLVSVQALHRFYRGRTPEIAASWMTREDRDVAIDDNIAYVRAALAQVAPDPRVPLVCVGFSQGVSMAFRAAVHAGGAGVIAVGGDVPPELFADRARAFPPLLIARGTADEWYTAEKLELDLASLKRHGANVRTVVYDAAHEWTPAVAEAAGAWLNALCVSRSIVS